MNILPLRTTTADVPVLVRAYVFLVVLLLPLDWFAPTGLLLREFGAKPATMLLVIFGFFGILSRPRTPLTREERAILGVFAIWLAVGYLAALLNFGADWSDWDRSRSPFTQLITQSMLVVVAGVALLGNCRLAAHYPFAELTVKYLPFAAVILTAFFILEASGLLPDSSKFLMLFRTGDPEGIDRPTGLFSEPSYYGVFAGLYGTALFFTPAKGVRRIVKVLLSGLLYTCAVLIGAKTFVAVAGVQAFYIISRQANTTKARMLAVAMLIVIATLTLFFMQYYSALDVESNLSSANRLGSSLLALNVILGGYGLSGIGFGQFHFFYLDKFAPDFLYLSWEALIQLSPEAINRASTYNFYLRMLVETGIVGFIVLVLALRAVWRTYVQSHLVVILLLFAGSLGFLMTQDTYFYPPLIFSSAILLASRPGHEVATNRLTPAKT